MTNLELKPQTAEQLEEFSKQVKKSVDELILYWLNNARHIIVEADESTQEDVTWTDEELAELLKPKKPLTGKQIAESGLLGSWADMGITDSVEWLEEQRAKRRKKFEW